MFSNVPLSLNPIHSGLFVEAVWKKPMQQGRRINTVLRVSGSFKNLQSPKLFLLIECHSWPIKYCREPCNKKKLLYARFSCCTIKCYICIILNSLLYFLFIPGLPQTKLGNYLETRVNDYLKRHIHPESGDVTIRVVHVSDKVVEVKPGMKSRWGTVQSFMWFLLRFWNLELFAFISCDIILVIIMKHDNVP